LTFLCVRDAVGHDLFVLPVFLIRVVQSDIAINEARTSPNDNSGTVGVGVSAVDVVWAAVGVGVGVGEDVAELDEGTGVGAWDEFGEEAKFANVLKASFGFPLLLKRPKLESEDLTV
jgi:hypothetical protein